MALEQALNFRGVDLPAAYQRISYIGISRKNELVVFEVETFADETAKDGLPLGVESYVIKNEPEKKALNGDVLEAAKTDFDVFATASAKDPVALAYDTIKAMPEFAGTKDV